MVRSIVGWRLLCVISAGSLARRSEAMFRSGIGLSCAGLVIGMSSSVSTDWMSCSGYCTPTKYWLWLTGSIQKLCLLNWMLELSAATTFFITSAWSSSRSAALARSTSMMYFG